MNKSTRRCAFVTEIISPYRIPPFNLLAQAMGEDFKVFFMGDNCQERHWKVPYEKINFQYEVMRGINLRKWSRQPIPLFLNPGLYGSLKRFSPDVVIVGGYHHASSFFALHYAKQNHKRLLLWSESTALESRKAYFFIEALKRWFLKRCDGFIVPGKASQAYLESYQVKGKIYRSPNSVDSGWFAEEARKIESDFENQKNEFILKHQAAQFNLLFVGRLSPEKGFERVLQILKELQAEKLNVGLIVAGEGPQRERYEKMAESLNLDHVTFLGFIQQEDLPRIYKLSDVLILPSDTEPWGLVVNEALACGTPVICSPRVGCAPDLVIEGKTGFVCFEIQDYINKIKNLYHQQDLLSGMAIECMQHIHQFSPQQAADDFLRAVKDPS